MHENVGSLTASHSKADDSTGEAPLAEHILAALPSDCTHTSHWIRFFSISRRPTLARARRSERWLRRPEWERRERGSAPGGNPTAHSPPGPAQVEAMRVEPRLRGSETRARFLEGAPNGRNRHAKTRNPRNREGRTVSGRADRAMLTPCSREISQSRLVEWPGAPGSQVVRPGDGPRSARQPARELLGIRRIRPFEIHAPLPNRSLRMPALTRVHRQFGSVARQGSVVPLERRSLAARLARSQFRRRSRRSSPVPLHVRKWLAPTHPERPFPRSDVL